MKTFIWFDQLVLFWSACICVWLLNRAARVVKAELWIQCWDWKWNWWKFMEPTDGVHKRGGSMACSLPCCIVLVVYTYRKPLNSSQSRKVKFQQVKGVLFFYLPAKAALCGTNFKSDNSKSVKSNWAYVKSISHSPTAFASRISQSSDAFHTMSDTLQRLCLNNYRRHSKWKQWIFMQLQPISKYVINVCVCVCACAWGVCVCEALGTLLWICAK